MHFQILNCKIYSKVKQVQTAISDLYDQVFVKQSVNEMKYNELPENLTEDAYL